MKHCKRCPHCTGCIWQFYSFDVVRVFLLRTYIKAILLKQNEFAEIHKLYRDIRKYLAFYPERRKIVLYIMRYKIILWLSVDEVGNHAV